MGYGDEYSARLEAEREARYRAELRAEIDREIEEDAMWYARGCPFPWDDKERNY